MIRFYGYDKCGTCRKAKKALREWGVRFEDIDITEAPPSAKQLAALLDGGEYALGELFNRSGKAYRDLDMKTRLPGLTRAQALSLLAGNGRLIKRPIVTDGKRHTVGFAEARFAEVWKPAT